MKADDWLLVFLTGMALGAGLALIISGKMLQREAVKHGAASYYLDENNERKWGWNDDLAKGKK